MMRRFFVMLIILSISKLAFPQSSVTGQVKNQQTREPIPYASVIVLNSQDSAISMALADDHGFFTLQLKPGQYSILLRYLGFVDDTLNIFVNGDKQVGIVYLKPKVQQIKGVTVKASKRKIDIDRQEVIVTKQMRSRSADVKELLNQVNGITYDRYKDQIAVDGQTNILILVNGLKKSYDYVQALNPERILKIQIVRDPGGRYGLEGYYAVVNIILKDNYQGFDFYADAGDLLDLDGAPGHKNLNQQESMNLNYTHGKVNLYVSQRFLNNNFNLGTVTDDRHYYNGTRILKQSTGEGMIYDQQYFNMTAGLDYQINPLNVISLELYSSSRPYNYSHEDNSFLVNTFMDSTLITHYLEQDLSKNGSNYYSGSVFYKGSFSHLELEGDMTVSMDKSRSLSQIIQNDSYLSDYYSNNTTKSANFNFEGTYYIGKFSINSGIGYNGRRLYFSSVNNQGQLSGKEINKTSQDQRLRAYTYLSWKPTHSLSLKAGAAFENYMYSGGEQKYNQWIAQPFANAQAKFFKDMLVLTLKYRTHTSYPSANQLDPSMHVIDSGLVFRGNPLLRPSTVTTFSLNTRILHGLLSVEPYYKFSHNYIAEIGRQIPDMPYDLVFSYENVGKYQDYGVRFNFTLPLSKKIIWKNEANIYWSAIEYDNYQNNVHDWTGSSQLIYYNPRIVTAGVMYQNFLSKRINAQGYSSNGNDFVGMFLQKQFFKDRLTLTAFYIFPINQQKGFIDYTMVNYTQTPIGYQYERVGLDLLKNIFNIDIKWRFSKGKVIKVKRPEMQQEQSTGLKSIL